MRKSKPKHLVPQRVDYAYLFGLEDGKAQGFADGEAKGLADGKRATALNMLRKNYHHNDILEVASISSEELLQLIEEHLCEKQPVESGHCGIISICIKRFLKIRGSFYTF